MSFVHLHNHTIFSAMDGVCQPADLARLAAEDGQPAVALTDHGTMAGMVGFNKACKQYGVKPIFGLEAYFVEWDSVLPVLTKPLTFHLTILAMTRKGLRNLMQLQSKAFGEDGVQRVTLELLSKYSDGLIVLSGCLYGFIHNMAVRHGIASGHIPIDKTKLDVDKLWLPNKYNGEYSTATENMTEALKSIFRDNFYIELQYHGLLEQEYFNSTVAPALASKFDIKTVCTNDVHYPAPADALTHGYLTAIRRHQQGGPVKIFNDMHFKSADEMTQLFPKAAQTTLEINEKIKPNVLDLTRWIPQFDTGGRSADDLLADKAWLNFPKMYAKNDVVAINRLEEELKVISTLGFSDYLLIVADLVERTAKATKRRPGPGRGSAAGSVLVHVLGITREVDPLKHGLLFSRFLSKRRFTVDEEKTFALWSNE